MDIVKTKTSDVNPEYNAYDAFNRIYLKDKKFYDYCVVPDADQKRLYVAISNDSKVLGGFYMDPTDEALPLVQQWIEEN